MKEIKDLFDKTLTKERNEYLKVKVGIDTDIYFGVTRLNSFAFNLFLFDIMDLLYSISSDILGQFMAKK